MKRLLHVGCCGAVLLATWVSCGLGLQAQHHQEQQHSTSTHAPPAALSTLTPEQDSLVAVFVVQARRATRKYQDLNTAIAAGYRLVGPDFPGMGEHWVHTRRIVQRDLRVDRPAVLSYLRIEGEPVLTGVAYAQPVRNGEEPPEFVLPGLWHFHSGSIDEETLILNPQSMHHDSQDLPRLAMVHAWIWTENPDGLFAQDNWALPFLRLGLPVPDAVPSQAGKALFLLSDGVAYYAQLIELAGAPSARDRTAVHNVLDQYHHRVHTRYQAMHATGTVTPEDLDFLAACWADLWHDLEAAVSPELWNRIHLLAG